MLLEVLLLIGWQGGNLLDEKLIEGWQLMSQQSVISSVLAAKLSAHYLKP